jgi:hypothetical protein
MNVEEFRKKAAKRYQLKYSDKSYGGLSWEDWYKLADRTSEIDYRCNFQDDGTCIQLRNIKEQGSATNEMCCCKWCVSDIGYLDFIQNDPKVIVLIARYFKAKVGFWRRGKGCILPRKYRSATCLGYRCIDSRKSEVSGTAAILLAFLNSIRSRSLTGKKLYNLGKVLLDVDI